LKGDKSQNFDRKGKQDTEDCDLDNMDWDAINSDELNSEDIDKLENDGRLITKKETKKKGEDLHIKFSAGFGEDVGKKLM